MEEHDYCVKCKTRYAVRDGCNCQKRVVVVGGASLGIALANAMMLARQPKETQTDD